MKSNKPVKPKKKFRNRALSKDRPEKAYQCKKSDITNKFHSCNVENGGHNFLFFRFDNYAMCSKCGDEGLF